LELQLGREWQYSGYSYSFWEHCKFRCRRCSCGGHYWLHTNKIDTTPPISIPPTPIISINGTILHSSASTGNQWYNESGIVNEAVNQNHQPIISGIYYIKVSEESCSSDTSNHISVTISGIQTNPHVESIKIYPNPFSDQLFIENDEDNEITIEIYNIIGEKTFTNRMNLKKVIIGDLLSKGVYLVKLTDGKNEANRKIVKQ
jgi:hypothetical protein